MRPAERAGFLAHARTRRFQTRVRQATERVSLALATARASVSISWGKDSVVLLHLVQQQCPEVLAVHVCEPESALMDNYAEVIDQYRERFGLPEYREIVVALGQSNVRAAMTGGDLYQTHPLAFMGLRAEESRARRATAQIFGHLHPYADGVRWRSIPLFDWTYEDVWAYTVLHGLPSLASYEIGDVTRRHSRTSAVTWVQKGGGVRGGEHGRIARLKEHAPEYYNELIKVAPWLASWA